MYPETLLRQATVVPKPKAPSRNPEAARSGVIDGPAHWSYTTTVHPCYVNGIRTLVHRRGLETQQPGVFKRLIAYAKSCGFALLEDRRNRELACRDERRRLAPVLLFAAAGLLSQAVVAADGSLSADGEAVVPTIDIIGNPDTLSDEREYLIEAGKRFVSKPHGEVELIMGVATQVRLNGEYRRVRTRGLQMPAEYTDSFIDRYDYTMPASCGGKTFSYYEGDGFAALGYHGQNRKMIVDVLAGGGPYAAPRLWGPYDQVLNSNVRMDLMMGDGTKDGMGVLKASYRIGLMTAMSGDSMDYYGELYSRAISAAVDCQIPHVPQVRQAETSAPKTLDEAG